jgi:hypothetical protein
LIRAISLALQNFVYDPNSRIFRGVIRSSALWPQSEPARGIPLHGL